MRRFSRASLLVQLHDLREAAKLGLLMPVAFLALQAQFPPGLGMRLYAGRIVTAQNLPRCWQHRKNGLRCFSRDQDAGVSGPTIEVVSKARRAIRLTNGTGSTRPMTPPII